ncbi:MAG TPA: tRNA guanosine(34) transglycosylase Tgt [Bacteroidales bacterium]|nr:tRNA guanosine(34) transglycosylase Tgt [Bacteroidales bacterium]HRZ49563.1 tRNA guanosine(34) transglycosylase Tgt [Bacteroidales bacterium]
MQFIHDASDPGCDARAGMLRTTHGEIPTPVFMPVGTAGSVKAMHMHDLKDQVDARIILGNTYHLYLRPGTNVLKAAGGLHRFNAWDRPILTDSGGYQVYSLGDRRKITEEGVWFQSHIDGSRHLFSPESVMEVQHAIGADIIMAFDECTPWPCEKPYAARSMEMTHRWLKRCLDWHHSHEPLYGYPQALFPIVQGSTFPDLRKISAETIAGAGAVGNAIGGLSVGEPAEEMYAITSLVCSILPKDRPRYLMGVGTPVNLLECIALGVDMFDCVMPTRNARNGMLFTREGVINIRNRKWQEDFSPLDNTTGLASDAYVSKSYLRHLFIAGEMSGPMIATLHNLRFYVGLMQEAREKIVEGVFADWKNSMVPKLSRRL